MIVSVISENTTCSLNEKNVKAEFGLSLYIEVNDKKILFDTGKSDLFIKNAKKMGIDLSKVDYLFISHGHFDHGGGLKYFLEINKDAKIFMHKDSVNKFYTKILGIIPYYIGLKPKVVENDRINFIKNNLVISENIQLITKFPVISPLPEGNSSLFEKKNKKFLNDKFSHEILLILKEDKKNIIFTGCSHSGIINMFKASKKALNGEKIDAVFGGFHTYNPVTKKNESKEYLNNLVLEIKKSNSIFFTGHCTGDANFSFFKDKLESKIQSMNCGEVIKI